MPVEPEELRRRLRALGFDVVRFATPGTDPGRAALARWLGAGHQADLAWMERTFDQRGDPALVLPGAASLIVLGVNYGPVSTRAEGDGSPIWARYALHTDYHDTIKPGLQAAGKMLEELGGLTPADYRYYVDTGPVLERGWAERAGLGFIGRNAMLISREYGNWLFLAVIVTRLPLPPDPPLPTPATRAAGERVGLLCGRCTRCLEACPTNALPEPGVVDARRCISYHTIENKGIIPRELRAAIGARIYGCDICAEVCPWNRFARQARSVLLEARPALTQLSLREILELTPERFAAVFRGTAMKRLKRRGLLRNACIVAGNTGAADCLDALVALAGQADPMVRAHAVWAVRRLGADARLETAQAVETDAGVLEEFAAEVTPVGSG
jgi:epoxyqueuosine reductase